LFCYILECGCTQQLGAREDSAQIEMKPEWRMAGWNDVSDDNSFLLLILLHLNQIENIGKKWIWYKTVI
jgi:hypothetical protein